MNQIFNYDENELPFSSSPFQVKGLLEGMVDIIVTDKKEKLVNMEELHESMEINTPFHKWIQRRIEDIGFEENIDFWTKLSKSRGGRPKTEYYFILDCAKEVALMENN